MSLMDVYRMYRTIDTDEEERLRKGADSSVEGRREYVEYFRSKLPDYYAKGLELIDETERGFRASRRLCIEAIGMSKGEMVEDMVYSLHRFGATYQEYFQFGFAGRNAKSRDTFATGRRMLRAYDVVNSSEGRAVSEDKMRAYERFGEYYGRNLYILDSEGPEFEKEFCSLLSREGELIVKPVDQMQGKGHPSDHVGAVRARRLFWAFALWEIPCRAASSECEGAASSSSRQLEHGSGRDASFP